MLLKKRFAVPEGNTSVGTWLSRMWSSTLETVPSPPDTTTRSNSRTSAAASSGSMPSPMKRMVTSSPACERARAKSKISSERGPEAGLWMMRQRMVSSLFSEVRV